MGYNGRDVEVAIENGHCVVVACDSCGAIGEKELDVVTVPAYICGRFTLRVALLEVLAAGMQPKIVTVAICNEPDPTGEEIVRGVRDELAMAGVGSLPIAISTEKNIPTRQTGLGISVVGMGDTDSLRIATTRPGDKVFCLGLPKVGPEVQSPEDPEIVQPELLSLLLRQPQVHDVIPVGSRGIQGEISTLSAVLGLNFSSLQQENYNRLDIHKSAGPATCLVFTAEPGFEQGNEFVEMLKQTVPFYWLGSF